jgi:hypothetical protein
MDGARGYRTCIKQQTDDLIRLASKAELNRNSQPRHAAKTNESATNPTYLRRCSGLNSRSRGTKRAIHEALLTKERRDRPGSGRKGGEPEQVEKWSDPSSRLVGFCWCEGGRMRRARVYFEVRTHISILLECALDKVY